MKKRNKNRKKKISRMVWIAVVILAVVAFGTAVGLHFFAGDKVGEEGVFGEEGLFANNKSKWQEPDELLLTYMGLISQEKYEQMYGMLDAEAAANISGEDFIKRNSAIYEGMEVRNMETTVISYDKKAGRVTYIRDSRSNDFGYGGEKLSIRGGSRASGRLCTECHCGRFTGTCRRGISCK